ncbi:MAG: type 4a pilus biogenesis protein PilO [Pseudomonadota bacterium]
MPKIKLDQEPVLREKVLFAAVLLGIFIIFSNYLWSPHVKKTKLLGSELAGLEQQADAVKKLIDATQTQLSKRQSEPKASPKGDARAKGVLERRVSDPSEEINSVVGMMATGLLAKRVKIKNVTVGNRIDKATYLVVPVGIDFAGQYSSIQNYMEAIEAIDRPLVVKSIGVKSDKDSHSNLNTILSIELYIVKH